MQTIEKITRKVSRVELNGREIAILEACLFDGMVRLLTDGKSFDVLNPDDDEFLMECRSEADSIRGIQRKLEFARTMIQAEQ